jgi:sodium transport system ATP-binding protein
VTAGYPAFAIRAQGLTKRFGKLLAVDHIDFSVSRGEIFGLLGPNGAGKTTTLRMLCTLLKPTDGTAVINGFDVRKQSLDVRRSIGVLPEDAGLYDRLSPTEHMLYYGRLHGMSDGDIMKRADGLLRRVELADRANEKVGAFSKGMKQKVALLRAFIHNPPVLLLDEPTAGLDVASARSIRDYMLSEKKEGKAVVLSTHNMTEAQKLCDRLAIINHGRIVALGTVEELTAKTAQTDLEEIFVQLVTE